MEVFPHFNLPPPHHLCKMASEVKRNRPQMFQLVPLRQDFFFFLLESYYKKAERKQVEIVGGELVKVEADLFYFRGEL